MTCRTQDGIQWKDAFSNDMIGTRGTVIAAMESVLERDARRSIHIAATHGLFVKDALDRFSPFPVERVVISDSLELSRKKDTIPLEIIVVSLGEILADHIRSVSLKASSGVRVQPLDNIWTSSKVRWIVELKNVHHLDSVKLQKRDALVVVDMQNDFMPGGALAVERGDSFVDRVNGLMALFKQQDLPIVLTQDWHPPDHRSFASRHPGKKPFDAHEESGIGPVLWPDHVVQGTGGAEFHPGLDTRFAEAVIRKGYHTKIDSYSGFMENDHKTETGLDGYLRSRGVKRIFICGLAADYCAYFTAADGAEKGYEVFYLSDLTHPVGSPPDSVEKAVKDMQNRGVRFVKSTSVPSPLKQT